MIAMGTRVVSGESAGARWEMAQRPIPAALRGVVRSWCGYVERTTGPSVRDELPIPELVLIFELGPPIRVAGVTNQGGFVGMVEPAPTRCEHDGYQAGVQVNLTPIGARRIFAMPLSELAGRIVGVGDVLARSDRTISQRLGEASTWDARFDLVEQALRARLDASRIDLRTTAWALDRIHARQGALSIAELSGALGYSHKHVITLFRDHVGIAPKAYAAIVRFDALVRHLRSPGRGSWSALAHRFGFSDQAHLAREVRRHAGMTATALRARIASDRFVLDPDPEG